MRSKVSVITTMMMTMMMMMMMMKFMLIIKKHTKDLPDDTLTALSLSDQRAKVRRAFQENPGFLGCNSILTESETVAEPRKTTNN